MSNIIEEHALEFVDDTISTEQHSSPSQDNFSNVVIDHYTDPNSEFNDNINVDSNDDAELKSLLDEIERDNIADAELKALIADDYNVDANVDYILNQNDDIDCFEGSDSIKLEEEDDFEYEVIDVYI